MIGNDAPSKMVKNKQIVNLIPAIFLALLLNACLKQDNPLEPDKNIKKVSIINPSRGAVYQFGDTLWIRVTVLDEFVIEYICIFVNGSLVTTDLEPPYEFGLYEGIAYRPGSSEIKVVAFSSSGEEYSDSASVSIEADDIPYYDAQVRHIYEHDADAFTQGLVFENGLFYESTGLYGESSLRKTTVETGEVIQIRYLNASYFAEGLTIWQNTLIQLTWQEQTGFVYDKSNFDSLRAFSYESEGWGLTNDESRLIMSDGTSVLFFLDPHLLHIISSITVKAAGQPVIYLNELEYIDGDVFANIWRTPYIARIDLGNGEVIGWIDLDQISQENPRGVLNGIAYDSDNKRLFVTGKRWSRMYEITLLPRKQLTRPAAFSFKKGAAENF